MDLLLVGIAASLIHFCVMFYLSTKRLNAASLAVAAASIWMEQHSIGSKSKHFNVIAAKFLEEHCVNLYLKNLFKFGPWWKFMGFHKSPNSMDLSLHVIDTVVIMMGNKSSKIKEANND